MEQKPKILEDQECFIRGCEVFKYLEVKIDKEVRQENDIKKKINKDIIITVMLNGVRWNSQVTRKKQITNI